MEDHDNEEQVILDKESDLVYPIPVPHDYGSCGRTPKSVRSELGFLPEVPF